MLQKKFNIPDGYRIEESRTRYDDVDGVVSFLSGRGANRVTAAVKCEENQAILVKHRLVCPHCRAVLPAYARYLRGYFKVLTPVAKKVSNHAIDAWGGAQSSLWDDAEETLILNQVYIPHEQYTCPKCSLASIPARGSIPVTITNDRKKVTITCCTTDIGELFRVPWKAKHISSLAFPYHERVTFNLKTGRSYISLQDNNMNRLATRNISAPGDWRGSKLYQLLSENTLVRRSVKRCIQAHWTTPIPLPTKDLTPDLLVKLVAYVDYPAFFYSRIPAAEDEYRAEKSFQRMSHMMHTAGNYQSAIRQHTTLWPKSIRRLLYSFPDYGFYLPEIELLGRLFPNADSFRAIFGRSFTYSLLSFFHQYRNSNIASFFSDYIQVKGTKSLLSKLEQKCDEVLLYALHYSCLTTTAQISERERWKNDRHIRCIPKARYALPMRCNVRIPDTQVGEFKFIQLKSKSEYLDASSQLNNCLKNWEATGNPVFVIRRKQQILGAIEVDDNGRIIQAKGKHNMLIPEICESAYAQWKDKYHLVDADLQQEIDDDEFPYGHHYFPAMFF